MVLARVTSFSRIFRTVAYVSLFPPPLEFGKEITVLDLNVCSLHPQGTRFHHTGALQFPHGIDNYRTGNPDPIRHLAGNQKALFSPQFFKDPLIAANSE